MICFAWEGFPQYAARCVGAFVKSTKERIVVLATRPSVPVSGMEEAAGCEVYWVPDRVPVNIQNMVKEEPRCLFSSAWHTPTFSQNWKILRKSGCGVIGMIDNNWEPSIKCLLNGVRFRLLYNSLFDGFMVPGKSGIKLLRSYGVSKKRIVKGMYRADASLFCNKIPMEQRPKRFLFIGRLNQRKNVLRMCDAFLEANDRLSENAKWTLDICGSGELQNTIPQSPYIVQHGFVQPENLNDIYQQARCFVLPSLSEHWGVVVHEAALAGCAMLLSNRVGAAYDFLSKQNGYSFSPYDIKGMTNAFYRVMTMPEEQMARAGRESSLLASGENTDVFVNGVRYCLDVLCRK